MLNWPVTLEVGCDSEVVSIVSEPLLISSPAEHTRLSTASDADVSCVTVIFGRLMTASSEAVGTCWSLGLAELTQLLAVSQSPPAVLVQIIVASKVRSSRCISPGRKARRCTRPGIENEVRRDRGKVRRMELLLGCKQGSR